MSFVYTQIFEIKIEFGCSVKLVEQELWQREEKGLIGVLPVRDSEAAAVGSLLAPGNWRARVYGDLGREYVISKGKLRELVLFL